MREVATSHSKSGRDGAKYTELAPRVRNDIQGVTNVMPRWCYSYLPYWPPIGQNYQRFTRRTCCGHDWRTTRNTYRAHPYYRFFNTLFRRISYSRTTLFSNFILEREEKKWTWSPIILLDVVLEYTKAD